MGWRSKDARWQRAEGGGVGLGGRGWVSSGEGVLGLGLIGKRKEGGKELGGGSPKGERKGTMVI